MKTVLPLLFCFLPISDIQNKLLFCEEMNDVMAENNEKHKWIDYDDSGCINAIGTHEHTPYKHSVATLKCGLELSQFTYI